MTELETAIILAFKGNAAIVAAAPGGLHNVEAPSSAAYPRIVFELPTGLKSNTFSHEKETLLIQFKIYTRASSSSTLNDLFDKLKAVYDDNKLSLTNYTTISLRRTVSIKTKSETDEKVWIYMVSYKIELEKN